MEVFKMGRTRKFKIRDDWDEFRDEAMLMAVGAKFSQNKDLQNQLLETKGNELIEHTHKDKYWADGGDGSGVNMLGKILMKVR